MLTKNNPFLQVPQNGSAVVPVGRGNKIVKLLLHMQGTAVNVATMIERVQVRVNQKAILDLSAAEILAIAKEKGVTVSAGFLPILFCEPYALQYGALYLGAVDTGAGVSSMDLDVTMKAAPADVSLDLYRDEVPPDYDDKGNPVGIGFIKAFIKSRLPINASGKYGFNHAVGESYQERVQRIHVSGPSGNVTAVGVKKNGLPIFEDIPLAVAMEDLAQWGEDMQASLFTVDLIKRGDGTEALYKGSARTLLTEITTDATGAVDIIEEKITTLAAL